MPPCQYFNHLRNDQCPLKFWFYLLHCGKIQQLRRSILVISFL
jgi:hypothetical protein